jgi:tetratricopeptide (TPR) repeat protein
VGHARKAGFGPLEAQATLDSGRVLDLEGKTAGALPELIYAHQRAQASREDSLAAESAIAIVLHLSARAELARARDWLSVANAAVDRLGRAQVPTLVARLRAAEGHTLVSEHEMREAAAAFLDAQRLGEAAGLSGIEQADFLSSAVQPLVESEQLPAALEAQSRALALLAPLGADHPRLGSAQHNLAGIHWFQGDLDRAIPALEEAVRIREKSLPEDHPDRASSLAMLGLALGERKRFDESLPRLERALQLTVAQLGADSIDAGELHHALASVLSEKKDAEAQLRHARRAFEIWEARLGPTHPKLLFGVTGVADALLNAGRPREALPYLDRGMRISLEGDFDRRAASFIRFYMARAVWDSGGNRRAAHEWANEAITIASGGDGRSAEDVTLFRRWLAEHPR